MKCDVLVVGSGIAGLSYSLFLSEERPDLNIVMVTKSEMEDSNSHHAQGGMAVVLDKLNDSVEQHIADTLEVGDGLCDPEVVRMVVERGEGCLRQLIEWGAKFDRQPNGDFSLAREGGHSAARVVHSKDRTGLELTSKLTRALLLRPNVKVVEHAMAIELIVDDQQHCHGCEIMDIKRNTCYPIFATTTVLANGGVGALYANTTNPKVATGDGLAMALRAGVKVRNTEFIQFHPTMFQSPDRDGVLVTEALRGYGAHLVNAAGERFMAHYDQREELAPRDVVSRAIYSEVRKQGNGNIYLNCQHLAQDALKERFPFVTKYCLDSGIDPAVQGIPVFPAAHYLCGGIEVDPYGRTSMHGLLAIGETSYTGLHGANRLASNSLLEAVVYGRKAFEITCERTEFSPAFYDDYQLTCERSDFPSSQRRKELQQLMLKEVAVIRTDEGLRNAREQVEQWMEEVETAYDPSKPDPVLIEYRNLLTVAYSVITASITQEVNAGCFFKAVSAFEA